MKGVFPKYIAEFNSIYSVQDSVRRITDAVSDPRNNMKIIHARYDGTQQIRVSIEPESIVWRSLRLAEIDITVEECESGSKIRFLFHMKKWDKILLCAICAFLLVFQIALVVFLAVKKSISEVITAPVGFPVLMIGVFYLISYMALESTAKNTLKKIFESMKK